MSKVQWKGGTFIYPIPAVMVSCGTMEESNIITVAWTGILNTNPAMCYISVRPERYSHDIIKENGEFAINLTTKQLAYATDWCGVKSGRDVDKFREMKLTKEIANVIKAPLIKESPVSVECKVKEIVPLGSHDMFVAEIVAVTVTGMSRTIEITVFLYPLLFLLFQICLAYPLERKSDLASSCRDTANFTYFWHPLVILALRRVVNANFLLFMITTAICLLLGFGYHSLKNRRRLTYERRSKN